MMIERPQRNKPPQRPETLPPPQETSPIARGLVSIVDWERRIHCHRRNKKGHTSGFD